MRNFIIRLIINAIGVAVTARLLSGGIHIANDALSTYLIIGLVFGLVNAFVKPFITLLSCSLVLFTFGLFILVINGFMFWITAQLLPGTLQVDSFGWAVLAGIVMSIVGMALEYILSGLMDKEGEPTTTVFIDRG